MSAVPDDIGARWAEELRQAAKTPRRTDDLEAMMRDNPDKLTLPYTWARDFPALKSPKMIVAGLIEAGTLICMFGDSNTGKSTLGLDMVLSACRGAPWRGRRTTNGVVLWLSLESEAGTRRRIAAYCAKHRMTAEKLLLADVTTAVQFLQVHDVESVIETIQLAEREAAIKCTLVVVDTLARAIAGGDENDGRDVGTLIRGCDRIRRETGAAVLIIHHSGKDSTKGARGHSSLRAAVDTEIEVSGQANPRQAKVTKQRDLPSGDVFAFDLEPVEIGTDENTGEPVSACVVVHRDDAPQAAAFPKGKQQAVILRALRMQQDEVKAGPAIWTLEEMRRIGRTLGQHKSSARDAVDGLVTSQLLTPTVGGYRLTEYGK